MTVNIMNMKRLQISMIMRASKIPWVILKRRKLWIHVTKKLWKHVTVISVFINASKIYTTQCMNARAQQRILSRNCPLVLWNIVRSKNRTLKIFKIVFQTLPLILSACVRTRKKLGMRTTKRRFLDKSL